MRHFVPILLACGVFASPVCAGETGFDVPAKIDEVALPPDPDNPQFKRKITCYRYTGFMVKQVDWGEVGAQKLALMAVDAPCTPDGTDERPFKDFYGYFLGRKADYLFFKAADGRNGGTPFYVYDSKTLKLLFEDSFEGDGFDKVETVGRELTLEFRRVYAAKCSLFIGGAKCAEQIKAEIKEMGDLIPVADCDASYRAEMKRTPDFADRISALPSVISYRTKLHFDGKQVVLEALDGETYCNPPT